MKALLLLALFGSAAHAADLPSLAMDLDGDGIADQIRVVPANKAFNRLEVTLSKSGKILSAESLLPVTFEQIGDHEDDGSGCRGLNNLSLRRGKARSFVISEVYSDQGGCAGELDREYLVHLGSTGLEVTALHVHSYSWSMGDPSPVFDLRLDFQARNARAEQYDVHYRNENGDKAISRASKPLPASCGPVNLSAFARDAIPQCAREAIQSLGLECGRQEGMTACPVAK
jgi:hypothetical protein